MNGRLESRAGTTRVLGWVWGTSKTEHLAWVPWIFSLPICLLKIQIFDWARVVGRWGTTSSP